MFCYNHSQEVCGGKPTYYSTSTEASTRSCLLDLLNNSSEMSGLQIHAEPCLNYFADRYVASSCCEPLPPGPQRWMEESFSVVTQLERNCWGHQVKNRELEMTVPSSLQDVALGPIAGDGWRGRRLPASLKEQLLKKPYLSQLSNLERWDNIRENLTSLHLKSVNDHQFLLSLDWG